MTQGSSGKAPLTVGVVMDPISRINIKKDSTFAMLLEAQRRGYEIRYMEPGDLRVREGIAYGSSCELCVRDDEAGWFELGEAETHRLDFCDVILMRRDPPFDLDYVYLTYILELAERDGVLVVNQPQALRDANEKVFISHFPQCCVPTVITRDVAELRAFVAEQGRSVVKPLDGMGGDSIFQLRDGDPNTNVILETITGNGRRLVMIQRYIEEISEGDKRILLVEGEPVPYALARFPGAGDFRGNLAKGGSGRGVPINDHDRWICAEVGPELVRRGIVFAGLDVIGDYLSEINVTSPTCIRELDAGFGLNIAGQMFDAVERRLEH
ncbi:MAG: glutathione synthase [Xanthomonadales bacterium]|nr:glutathione synthase [Xanthomonadales bacterium]